MEEEKQRQEQGFKKIRFDVQCEEYRQQHLPLLKSRTGANYRVHIERLELHFADRYIDEVRKAHVAEFVAHQKRAGLKQLGRPDTRFYLQNL